MKTATRPYIVTDPTTGKDRIVETYSKASARRFVLRTIQCEARVGKASEIATLCTRGVKVERPGKAKP